MYISIIILPLIGSLISGLMGRKLGNKGSQIITIGAIGITTILTIIAFKYTVETNNTVELNIKDWITIAELNIKYKFNFDSLTVSMLLPVLIVSILVHIYSSSYMSHDPSQSRFFSYLNLFTFFMIILVTSNNYLLMFIGWEGVGICSYLLVNFWFTRIQANKSAMSAILTNRVGDMFLTIGLFLIINILGSLDYSTIFSTISYINTDLITIISILLLLGAMAKSAQLGLHVWLPQAMEGPTPVSALIHAATMVTAGVYLLMRSSYILEYSSTALLMTLWVGGLTSIFAATIGISQNDVKKVIAYSTCSQLGMLLVAIGLSQYNAALYHLINHAYFKALLFLGAGSLIHTMNDEQDMRKYGGLIRYTPFTYSMILIGSLSLMAVPYLSGYYSKDLIIELSFYGKGDEYLISGITIYYILNITALCTTLYSLKTIYLTYLGSPNANKNKYKNSHEPDLRMGIPLIILSILSIYFGYIFQDLIIGIGSEFLSHSLYIDPRNQMIIEAEDGISILNKLLPLMLTIIGAITSLIYYEYKNDIYLLSKKIYINKNYIDIYRFLNQRYYFELILNNIVLSKILKIGYILNKEIDKGVLETLGPNGLTTTIIEKSKGLSNKDQGFITRYAMYILLGLIAFITIIHKGPEYLNIIILYLILIILS
jgi:NADH-ubiquinone oxidoreductase chain 5